MSLKKKLVKAGVVVADKIPKLKVSRRGSGDLKNIGIGKNFVATLTFDFFGNTSQQDVRAAIEALMNTLISDNVFIETMDVDLKDWGVKVVEK